MKKKRLLSCVLIVALLLSLCAIGVGAATVDDFTDVSPDDWYYDAVSEVAAAGYFNGTSATTFDPQLTMTRAMFVTVLARFDGATVDNSADTTFTDVPTGQYYTGAVAWAAENGLVQGYGGNAFGTSNPITRQDMAVLMTRYIAYYEAKNSIAATTSAKGSETTHDVVDDPAEFADAASIAAYATEAVVECANYGLLIGDDNGNFRPTASATRAEAAAVISRLSWTVEEIDRLSSGGSGGGGGGGSSTTYYYLKLDLNGGTLDESIKPYSSANGVLTFRNTDGSFDLSTYSEAATLANYTLAGWNDSAGTEYGTTDTFTSSAKSANNAITLYAQWTEATDETYTLTYSFEGATLTLGEGDTTETYEDTYVVEGIAAGTAEPIITAEPEMDGYTFNVWKDKATNTEYKPGDTITVNGNVTLTADFDADVVIDTDDKIGLSVFTAIGEFDTRVYKTEQYFTTTKIDGTRYTYAQTGDLAVTADKSTWNVGDEDAGATREVTVAIDAAVDADSLETITRVAASMARDMVSGTAVSSLTAADLRRVVTEVVKQLEEATGLNLSLDVNTIVDSLRGEGSSFWNDTEIGEYVSGMTVTIPVPTIVSSYTAELEFTVDDGAVTLVKTDDETLRTAAIACAKAIAVQLYDSLQGNLYGTTLSDKTDNFALSAEVDIEFVPNAEYADTVAPYATNYKLNVTASFDSNDTILFAYNNDTIDVALNMTNADIVTKYENGYVRALNSATVQNRIASMVESMITSGSSEEGSGNVLSTITDILVDATEDDSMSDVVTEKVTEWVNTNITNGLTGETENDAIYELVDMLAEATIDSTISSDDIADKLVASGAEPEQAATVKAYVDAYQEAYTAATESGTTLTEDDIAEIKASVAETDGDVDAVIDELIAEYLNGDLDIALSVMEDSDADSWTALIAAAEAESGSATMQDILDLLTKLGTVDGLKVCTVAELGNLLQSGLLDNYSGMVSTALNSISNINITTPASLNNAITIKIKANGSDYEIGIDSDTLEAITGSENGINKLGEILTDNFVDGETVADLYLELYVEYAPVSMYIDFSLYFG
ncbi:MAG: S-layer homology domain-containing protein [Oscillospiraceae bacterium]|nr:S-layer homology domain-containing protein [Oscillospiraceae bacterium]